jgi:hypothetical protein
MSHPNPILFQINRLDVKLVAGWIFQQVLVRTRSGVNLDSKDAFVIILDKRCCIILYERV